MLVFQTSVHGGGDMSGGPLAVTFEAAVESLESLPRMFVEPDGSFVWTGDTSDGQKWQVDGNLIDQGDRLAYIELKGTCPAGHFDTLLGVVGWPEARLAFQLRHKGLFVDEAEFRRLAVGEEGAV